jgi:serine/threonine-protein kinase HipA
VADKELIAYLDGRRIGTLTQASSGRVTFAYDADYRTASEATPLSLSIPLTTAAARPSAIRAFIAGLLPDSEAALARLGRKYGVSPRNPFALLTHIGMDAAGAVQLVSPDAEPSDAATRQGDIRWLSDAELDQTLHDLANSPDDWNPGRDTGRWSLAGAQSKVALFRSAEGVWGIPEDSTPSTHILKPSMPNYEGHHLNEHLCLSAARLLGLPAARTGLLSNETFEVLISERYDRRLVGDRLERIHQEDLCQALGIEPTLKYEADGGPGVRAIGMLMRSSIPGASRDTELWRFFDYLVFNVAIGATDAHAKNFSLLLRGDDIRMAPLYDVASILPYDADRGSKSAMRVGKSWELAKISASDWRSAAAALGIDAAPALERVDVLRKRIPEAFQTAAVAPSVPSDLRPRAAQIADMVSAFVERRFDVWGRVDRASPRQPPV